MKRLLLWLVGVALGVVVLLGAVMAVSYAFTTQGSCPAPEVRFGDEALEVNRPVCFSVFSYSALSSAGASSAASAGSAVSSTVAASSSPNSRRSYSSSSFSRRRR